MSICALFSHFNPFYLLSVLAQTIPLPYPAHPYIVKHPGESRSTWRPVCLTNTEHVHPYVLLTWSMFVCFPVQLCASRTTTRPSCGASPTAPTCWTGPAARLSGWAWWTSCWPTLMTSASPRESPRWARASRPCVALVQGVRQWLYNQHVKQIKTDFPYMYNWCPLS